MAAKCQLADTIESENASCLGKVSGRGCLLVGRRETPVQDEL